MPDFNVQLWMASNIQDGASCEPTARRMRPMNIESVAMNGKPCRGLWTSTRLARGFSDWVAWCASDMTDFLADRWALEVSPSARVLHVATCADVEALPVVAAQKRIHCNSGGFAIDWRALARSFDGVHIVNPNIVWRFSSDFASECTFWFRWSFTRVWLDMRSPAIHRRSPDSFRHKRPARFADFAS